MRKENYYKLEDVFSNEETKQKILDDMIEDIKKEKEIIVISEDIDNYFEYIENKLKELHYSIKKIGNEKLTNNGKYLIIKQ